MNRKPPQPPLAGLDRPVRAVVEKGLRKAPERRYHNALHRIRSALGSDVVVEIVGRQVESAIGARLAAVSV